MGVLPEFQDGETERDIRKMNRGGMPKLAPFEVAKLQNFDMPLSEAEWNEMAIDIQQETLEVMNVLKKEPIEEGEGEITTTVTSSPKPPPKAPTTFARDPIRSSQSLLRRKDSKWEDTKGKDHKGDSE